MMIDGNATAQSPVVSHPIRTRGGPIDGTASPVARIEDLIIGAAVIHRHAAAESTAVIKSAVAGVIVPNAAIRIVIVMLVIGTGAAVDAYAVLDGVIVLLAVATGIRLAHASALVYVVGIV